MRYFISLFATAPLIRIKEPEQRRLRSSSKIVEASGREATSCNVHLSASYDLEGATARSLGGGFHNEKDVSNNSAATRESDS